MKPSDRSLVASRLLLRSRWLFALAAIAAGLAVAFLLGGCTSLPGVARALAADTNTLHLNLVTPWGTLEADRNVAAGGALKN